MRVKAGGSGEPQDKPNADAPAQPARVIGLRRLATKHHAFDGQQKVRDEGGIFFGRPRQRGSGRDAHRQRQPRRTARQHS